MSYNTVQIDSRSFQRFKDDLSPVLDVSGDGRDRHEIVSERVDGEIAVYHDDMGADVVTVVNVSSESAVESYVKTLVDEHGWADDSYDCIYDKFGLLRSRADG